MRERDVFDLLLVAAVGIAAYLQTFGLADPRVTVDELLALLAAMDVRVYLVLGGLFGLCFVGYLVIYLPKRSASQSRF